MMILQIQVGEMDWRFHPVRGTRVRIVVHSESTAADILKAAVAKMAAVNKKFNEVANYSLHYRDGTLVETLQSSKEPFVLRLHKQELLMDYARITLFVRDGGMHQCM
jgi:hypothetical protein